jgi:VIT1/CCC1 family predicted Fe2+/Mn2+ transporter
MAKDALAAAYARDELGISSVTRARPAQASRTSAVSFAAGALMPLLVVLLSPVESIVPVVFVSALFFLGALGAGGARTGGASMLRPSVSFFGVRPPWRSQRLLVRSSEPWPDALTDAPTRLMPD